MHGKCHFCPYLKTQISQPRLQELSTSRLGRPAKRGHIGRIRLVVPIAFTMKSGDIGGVDSPISKGCCPEHAESQEEGQPRVEDHLREEAAILRLQPATLYEPMEPGDEILPSTVSGK